MAEIKLLTKILNKYDSKIASDAILGRGEINFVPVKIPVGKGDATETAVLMKVGDGYTTYANLNYVAARAADVYDWAKAANKPDYNAIEIKELKDFYSFATDENGKLIVSAKQKLSNGTIESTQVASIDFVNHAELTAAISDEATIARAAEAKLAEDLAAETEARTAADTSFAENLALEAETARAAELANANAISAINNEDTGILAQAKDYVDDEDIFVTDILTVNALGGIAAGTDLNNLTTHEVLKKLLYPYVAQTVTNVSRTPNATVLEKGNDQVITAVSAKVTKKSEKISKVELLKGSEVIATKEGTEVENGGTITFSGLNVEVPSSNVVLTIKATDATGNAVTASTANWTFVYPYYYGVCDAEAAIDEALVEGLTKDVSSKGQKAYSYSPNNQCAVIAYPKAHGVLKSALDPNSFENIASFTKHEVSITGLDGTAQAYYVYVSGAFTGSGFKYTFKY